MGAVLSRDPLSQEAPAQAKGQPQGHLYGAVQGQRQGVSILVEADAQENTKPRSDQNDKSDINTMTGVKNKLPRDGNHIIGGTGRDDQGGDSLGKDTFIMVQSVLCTKAHCTKSKSVFKCILLI